MKSINLLIVDNRRLFRDVLRRLLEHCADFHVVDDVGGRDEAEEAVLGQEIDIVVFEYVTRRPDGLEMIGILKRLRPHLKVVVLSGHRQLSDVARVLAAGADGFLAAGGVFEELVCGIRHVANGERYICPSITHDLAMRGIESDSAWRRTRSAPALAI